ncbi:MAG: class I SAM-dependent methyltransferase [Thermodesulfobacteriota bacterium]|nr:class I SAM-dependent methyltransferase [Thermodesulfobacteriota bacterium]
MTAWVWPAIILIAGLFAIKITYVLSTAFALPATQGALYVSTPKARIRAILDEIAPQPGQRFLDIGCGDGRVLRAVARRFPEVTLIGYEVNPMAFFRARLATLFRPIRICRKNFWKTRLDDADIIFCYLFPDVLKRLAQKLRIEARPGTLVISCNFPIPTLTPEKTIHPDGALIHDPVYFYRIK